MEKFCQYIEKLLAQHDYAVVPSLGGFVVQMQSAQILPDRITAPVATIAFNPLMHHADGLLAIEIAHSEQISYRLAMEYIDREIDNIKSALNSTGNVRLGNLGFINQHNKESYIFTPLAKNDFLPQNFQLSDLYISTKDSRNVEKQKKITITLPSTRMFRYAAAAMLIFGLFFIAPKVNDVRQTNSADLASISLETKRQNISTPTTLTIPTKKSVAPVAKPVENKVSEAVNNFHVIVASLPTLKSAEKFCKELASKEFPNAQVLPPSKTYRIEVQSFSNKEEAIRYMENLRKTNSQFKTAWVLCDK